MTPTPFLPPTAPRPVARVRLFCLPFAGGGAGIYATWPDALGAGVDVAPIQLPGRERRLREPPYTSMPRLVEDLLAALRPSMDVPWAVFGHSMGAAIAHALARAATAAGTPPVHLFVSARRAPGVPPAHPPLFALPRDRLVAEVERRYGPLPEVLRRHPALLDTFLPTMRADLELLDTWIPPVDVGLACPITAYGGADDGAVPPSVLDGWAAATAGRFRKVVLPGDHFGYVRDAHHARDDVARTLAAPGAGAVAPGCER